QRFTWAEWRRPVIAVIITFLCTVESSMLSIGEWPYMSTIDHDATSSFYGISTAVNKAGHAICAFVFAVWAHRISAIRIPLIVGRCITLFACFMYIFVEFIPANRRWWMMVCYLLFGVGFGTSPLLRSYIARHTSEENRSTAYALQSGATVLSVVVGPMAQIAFSWLPYPGAIIIPPNLKFNIYTAPIWVAVITNVIAITLTLVSLDDPKNEEFLEKETSPAAPSLSFGGRIAQLRSLHLPWLLILLVIFSKIVSQLALGTIIVGPMFTAMYAFSGEDTALVLGIAQVVVGVIALALSLLFFVFKLGRFVSMRALFLSSLIIVLLSYIIIYPFPFSSSPMQPFNETTRSGCNTAEYSWCDTALIVNIIPFLITMVITNAVAMPSTYLSLDTIYSKLIGNIDQNIMQSFFVIAEDISMVVSPIYAAEAFTFAVLNVVIINGVVFAIGTPLWLAAWKCL
ncbi:hypothetical protein PFISCL1PPCAC_18233, partial [Pristionchus fissidentatus]